jgi:hypothetical protein
MESHFNDLFAPALEMYEAAIREFVRDFHKRRYPVHFQINLHQEAVAVLV